MVDLEYLAKLLSILKTQEVQSFKEAGLEISFHVEQSVSRPTALPRGEIQGQPLPDAIAAMHKKEEESLPPDLRTDNITDFDKILNWSASPDPKEEQPLPLTGEGKL